MESSHFLAVISPCALYKTLFLDFLFRPRNTLNLLPKIYTKLPVSWLVWQIHRRCLGLTGGLRGWLIQWNHAKCCGLTLVAMATKFGLGSSCLTACFSFLRTTAYMLYRVYATPIPSVTRVYCIKTAERIIEILSPFDRRIILVFCHQGSLRKCDGFTPVAKYKRAAIFDQYAAISRKR